MGATLDETRLELEAQRAAVRDTANRLDRSVRRAFDLRAKVREHPVETVALAAGAVYFLIGGPRRTVRFVRRAVRRSDDGARAYAGLPNTLRELVDATAPGHGAARDEARRKLALALQAWREDPKNRRRAEKLVSETLTPPGPERAFWAFVEIAAITAAGIIGRRVIARRMMAELFSSREPGTPRPAATPPAGQPDTTEGRPNIAAAQPDIASRDRPPAQYTGWSGQRRPEEPSGSG